MTTRPDPRPAREPESQFARALAFAGLALTSLFWAGNVVIARGVNDLIPPVALSFWRWFLAFLLILPLTWKPLWQKRDLIAAHWPWLTLLAALSVGFFNTLLYLAAHSTDATNIGLINSSMPVQVLLLSLLILRAPLKIGQSLGILSALVGMLVIIAKGNPDNLTQLELQRGDLYMVLAVFFWSLYSVLLKRRPVPLGGLEFLAVQIGLGALVILPLYLLELGLVGGFSISPGIVPTLAYVAIFPGILAYGLWNYGVQRLGPQSAAMSAYLIPLFVALLAWLLLGEPPHHYHVSGGALVLLGVYLATRRPRTPV